MTKLGIVGPPKGGLWRVARGPDPLEFREPPPPLNPGSGVDADIGNRFDSALADYRVLYFGSSLEGCYGETLAHFRPSPTVLKAAGDEEGFMHLGDVPRDWRIQRQAVRIEVDENLKFLDVEDLDTRTILGAELAWVLNTLDMEEIDVSAIRYRDRRLTRWISQWTHEQLAKNERRFGGVRFCSRINSDWELWAVFDSVHMVAVENIPILSQDDALRRVAKRYSLNIH